MHFRMVRGGLVLAACGIFGAASCLAAENPTPKNNTGKASASSSTRSTTQTRSGARGTLPDPDLLDGSSHPAEKRPEYGMLGDFELPGTEGVRSDRVGGAQQMPQGAGAQGVPMSLPQGGSMGGAQGAQGQMGGQAGAQAAGAQAAAGQQAQNAGGPASGAPADPNAGGIQASSGQPGGDPGQAGAGDMGGQKPPQVAIGDASMQIGGTPAGSDVVGAQQIANPQTQHHEKGTGTGGRGAGGTNANRGVERGRAMPAGL